MLHYFCVAGVHSISRLHHEPKWNLVLESCIFGLWHMGLGWGRLCKELLRTIGLTLKANNPDPSTVPLKVATTLKHLGRDLWTATNVSSLAADYLVHHVPPNGAQSGSAGFLSFQTLESLIRDMNGLSMKLPHIRQFST